MAKWVWQRFILRCSCGADYSGALAIKSQTVAMQIAHRHVCAGHTLTQLEQVT